MPLESNQDPENDKQNIGTVEYAKSGDNDGDDDSTPENGVSIPEDFQKQVHGVMSKCTNCHHIDHVRSKLNEKEKEMRDKEMKGKRKSFSMDDAPTQY